MAQQAYIYHRRVDKAHWVTIIEQIHQIYPLAYMYAENRADMRLKAYSTPSIDWASGRAFGNQAEVRWSKQVNGQVDITLLTEKQLEKPEGWTICYANDEILLEENNNSAIMLLGVSKRHSETPGADDPSNAAKVWVDSRMPPFEYPVSDEESKKRWVQIKTKTYCLNQRPVLIRMVSLEGTSDVKKL